LLDPHELLTTLAIVLCTAGAATVLFRKLRQPVVLGYLLAGMIVGPHLAIPLYAHEPTIRTLSELGVILLLFGIGLELRIGKLVRIAASSGVIAVVQCSLMLVLGYLVGRAFGWTRLESVYTGAIIAISSTTIIAKTFSELEVKGRVAEIVLGVLIGEDFIAILLLAVLTAISSGGELSAHHLASTAGRLAAFLVGFAAIGLLVLPRMVRAIVRLNSPETTLIATIGICFACATLASVFGYSVALGAFIAGSLVAESGHEKIIEPLVDPVKNVFSAIFFVSVGMLINPAQIARHWLAVLVLVPVVVVGKLLSVGLGALMTGHGKRTSLQAGLSLAQIGEFSFIIAALGLTTGATRSFLYPVAVAVSAITTLITPWLIRASQVVHASES
jgi:CPA2 family monovalent cation:H+ antiporter-2